MKETLPNVVLLKNHMPKIDGFEVTIRLKKDEATKTIPVIIMTAQGEAEDRLKALEAGVGLALPRNATITFIKKEDEK